MIRNIVVGMSGGVDSAVTALLLKRKGFNVTGVFMKNWDTVDETGQCRADQDYKDAEWVCNKINIPLEQVNFVKEYWLDVFSYLVNMCQQGFTPNVDVYCNKNIKFDKFYHIARSKFQADAIAMGHYARSSFGPYLEHFEPDTDVKLLRARDKCKDQTFFLCQVPQEPLRRCLFPLGDYLKSDVKNIAMEAGLDLVAKKKESAGICFIGKREFKEFISNYVEEKPGDFIDFDTGAIVGKHAGIHYWTVGQRCQIGGLPTAYYVFQKDVASNIIFVVNSTDHPALFSHWMITRDSHWIAREPEELKDCKRVLRCEFRFQHTDPLVGCNVYRLNNDELIIRSDEPVRAINKGQFAVLYSDEECLGGSKITTVGPSYYALNKQLEEPYKHNKPSNTSSKPL